jgi:hypothetical protein
MPISYETGATFRIVDEASGPLERIAAQLREMNALVDTTKASFKSLTEGAFAGFGSRAQGAISSLGELGKAAKGASTEIGGVGKAGAAGLRELGASTDQMGGLFKALTASAETSASSITKAFSDAARAATADIAGLDAKVAASASTLRTIAEQNAVATAGGGGGGAPPSIRRRGTDGGHGGGGAHIRGSVHTPVEGLHIGGDDMVPGLIGGATLYEMISHGLEAQHWISQFRGNGMTDGQIRTAYDAAVSLSQRNANTSIVDNLKNIIELNKATGNIDESERLLPAFALAKVGMQSVKAEDLRSKFNSGMQVFNFARGLDEMGVTQMGKTPEEREKNITRYSNELLRTMVSSRGLFDGNALFAMTNNSGGASLNWDERFGTTIAPIIGDIMKSSKLGNANYMALKSYVGGHITPDAVAGLVKWGLTEPGDTWQDTTGKLHLRPNSKFAEGAMENLYDWSGSKIERLRAHGFDPSNHKLMAQMVNEIGSNKSTSMLMRVLFEPLSRLQISKEIALRDKVPQDAAGILQGSDPVLKIDAFKNKISDLFTVLGTGGISTTAMMTLTTLTSGLQALSRVLESSPLKQAEVSLGVAGLAGWAVTKSAGSLLGLKGVVDGAHAPSAASAIEAAAKTAAPSIARTFFTSGLKAGLKGGVIGGIADLIGETAIEWLMPMTPEGRKVLEENSVGHYLGKLWGVLGPAQAKAAALQPSAQVQPWYRDLQLRDAYARQSASHPLIGGERDMEGARARALSSLPAPKVTLSLLNNVKVFVDGREIASRVEAEIVRKYEHSTVAPASDTHASYVDPDYGFATG